MMVFVSENPPLPWSLPMSLKLELMLLPCEDSRVGLAPSHRLIDCSDGTTGFQSFSGKPLLAFLLVSAGLVEC